MQARIRRLGFARFGRLCEGAYGRKELPETCAAHRFASSPAGFPSQTMSCCKQAATSGAKWPTGRKKPARASSSIFLLFGSFRLDEATLLSEPPLPGGIKKMQVNIADAARGGKTGQEARFR